MNMINKIKPAVPKRILFFLAAFVWVFASYKILNLGLIDVIKNTTDYWINIAIGLVIFYLFFKYVFYKMYLKHTKRIINSRSEFPCMFSFFDIKGYIIMFFMITAGITLRKADIIPHIYLATFYIGLGLAIFLAAISFVYSGIRYNFVKDKFYNTNI
ncbi:hypothetical protein [Clostridium lundense]|uniref:hypothetical protein n=1 Tax=Clostridium lundense TaxID=319475 RepID=UPI00048A173A|nr:hypothetical protein [Clostridium lundense]